MLDHTRSVFLDVAYSQAIAPEARRVIMAIRRYIDFLRAWPAGAK